MNIVINERPAHIPLQAACHALGVNRSSVYARRRAAKGEPVRSRQHSAQPRALSVQERAVHCRDNEQR